MNRSLLTLLPSLGLVVLPVVPSAAQNLLTTNAGFEANTAYYTPGWGFPQGAPDALPGWVITLDQNGDGYAGAASNQTPQGLEGTHFGYIFSGTGSAGRLETSPESRGPVEAGATYTLWFLARGDASWSEALATVSLVWYPNRNNDTDKGQISLDLNLPPRASTDDPMQTCHVTGVAPQGAHYAGARVTRPANDYAPLILDDVVIMAEPVDLPLSISNKGPHAEVRWPRNLTHRLEEKTGIGGTNTWRPVDKPAKGVGATNYLDCDLTDNAHFFRLAAPP